MTSILANATRVLLIIVATTAFTACATKPYADKADVNLVDITKGNFDHVMLIPGTKVKPINKIYIEDPTVSFNEYWLTDWRDDYTKGDLDRITSTYSRLLKESLTKGISKDTSIVIVDSPAAADIVFRPKLEKLNIYAPDLSKPGITTSYVHEYGNGTFDLTLINASDNRVLAQFIDHRETNANPGTGIERTNRGMNAHYFGLLFDRWTRNLTDYLLENGAATKK